MALLGDTNSGKSTLINAVTGGSILPKSGVGVGTATMTELYYADHDGFEAEVRFASRGELTKQCLFLYENRHLDALDTSIDLEFIEMLAAMRRRLSRIYGESLDRYLDTGSLGYLRENDESQAIIAEGTRQLAARNEHELQDLLIEFVDSSGSLPQLVDRVRIGGRFDALRTGVTLVDLPGLNDPDVHRSAITQRHIAEADMVWIVFSIDVGVAKSLLQALQSMVPMHELLLEGRANRLAFVVTKCDQYDSSDAKKIGVDPAEDLPGFMAARQRFVEDDLRAKLDLLTMPLRRQLGSAAARAIEMLRSSPVYFVSSLDHLRFVGSELGATAVHHDGDRNVRELAERLVRIGAQHSVSDALGDLERELAAIEATLQAIERGAGSIVVEPSEDFDAYADGLPGSPGEDRYVTDERTVDVIRRFRNDLDMALDELHEDLSAASDQLVSSMTTTANNSFGTIDEAVERWSQLSPTTVQAALAHRGIFTGQGGARHDFNADIAQPFLLGAYPAWSAWFDHTMPVVVRQFQGFLTAAQERAAVALDPSEGAAGLTHNRTFEREAIESLKRLRLDAVAALIETVRGELKDMYDLINVGPGFRKQQAFDLIRSEVAMRQDQLRAAVLDELRDWLGAMAESVQSLAEDEVQTRMLRVTKAAR